MDVLKGADDLYRSGQFRAAVQAAQALCDRRPNSPEAWWLLARAARHAGLEQGSDIAFNRAAALDPTLPVPYRLTRERFTELVLSVVPEGEHLHIQALPRDDLVQTGVDPDALVYDEPEAARLVFQANFENRVGTAADLRSLVERQLGGGRPGRPPDQA